MDIMKSKERVDGISLLKQFLTNKIQQEGQDIIKDLRETQVEALEDMIKGIRNSS